jgi:hypothetical protein
MSRWGIAACVLLLIVMTLVRRYWKVSHGLEERDLRKPLIWKETCELETTVTADICLSVAADGKTPLASRLPANAEQGYPYADARLSKAKVEFGSF